MRNNLRLACALGAALAAGTIAHRAAAEPRACGIEPAPGIVFEIDPRLEFMAGLQSQTAWTRERRGPGPSGSAYFDELSAFFAPYARSAAVRRCASMAATGFSYEAPCQFALSLEAPGLRSPSDGWPAALRSRAGGGPVGAARLGLLRSACARLYEESGFDSFFTAHESAYRAWLESAAKGFDGPAVADWLERFYAPSRRAEYHFAFAPAMFPAGGYGFSLEPAKGGEGPRRVYQVVRAGDEAGRGPAFPAGGNLALLALHEFGHSYVNPALAGRSGDPRLEAIFHPVREAMARQAYPTLEAFLNELVIRASVVAAGRDLGLLSPLEAELELRNQEALGFYPIRAVLALLRDYQASRARYATFDGFAPELLARLAADSEAIVAAGAERGYRGGPAGAEPAAAVQEGFEGALGELGLPAGFSLDLGARSSSGDGSASQAAVERGPEGSALALAADTATSLWCLVSRPVAPRDGTLSLRYRARGEEIRKEPGQFGGSYVGLILTAKDGRKSFSVSRHAGSFGWSAFALERRIDASSLRTIELAVFLNESGRLWVDDIELGYLP